MLSSCVAFLLKDQIFMSSDGAVCTLLDNRRVRVGDRCNKISILNSGPKEYLIFSTGNVDVIERIKASFNNTRDRSINSLYSLAKEEYYLCESFLQELPEGYRDFELFIGCIEDNRAVLYIISSFNDFRWDRHVTDEINIFIAGFNKENIEKAINKYKGSAYNLLDLYFKVYTDPSIECAEVGGEINIYSLNDYRINHEAKFYSLGLGKVSAGNYNNLLYHSDGSYTQISSGGLERYVSGQAKKYKYLYYTDKVTLLATNYGYLDIKLPTEFLGLGVKGYEVHVAFRSIINTADNFVMKTVMTFVADKKDTYFTLNGMCGVVNLSSPSTLTYVDMDVIYFIIA